MCGITGFVDFGCTSELDDLNNMTDALQHRGPDDRGTEFFSLEKFTIGLGFQRLSIIDLSKKASQPMWYKHWCIIYNGEIYNFEALRSELQALGHVFNSLSDTEVILHAWDEWKEKAFYRFNGMFAFVIYNALDSSIVAVRDRTGVKPLYYYWNDGLFMFSSELKSFHSHPRFKKELSKQAVLQYIQYGYILAPYSIFENTFKLPAGHSLTFSPQTQGMEIKQYWNVFDYYDKPKLNISYVEAKEEIRRLLLSAAQCRMVADVPIGIFLSGGYDSTAITALLQTGRTEKLNTFTIGLEEEAYNEAVYAKKVAGFLGTNHSEQYCTQKEVEDIIPTIPFFCDEPFGDSSIIPTMLLSRLAKKQVSVALSADAGDEIFGGYKKYSLALDLFKKISKIPEPIRGTAASIFSALPNPLLSQIFRNDAVVTKKSRLAQAIRNPNMIYIMDDVLSHSYAPLQLEELLSFNLPIPSSLTTISSSLASDVNDFEKMMAVDYKTYLPDDILVKVDRASMSVGLEARCPLLDYRIVEFTAQLPASFKLKNSITKKILKDIVHDLVPQELVNRPKMGFGVPIVDWLRKNPGVYLEEYFSPKALDAHGLFKQEGINKVLREWKAGNKSYYSLFWFLLMFQLWYKRWMD
ncbi:MAG: asparagine synthase (glutamine-hydrolyzing) [Ferruginibacter sp.]|nr:asparagine synthase (glutamine-hydrolyzing) [Ferruginibacter sp.]